MSALNVVDWEKAHAGHPLFDAGKTALLLLLEGRGRLFGADGAASALRCLFLRLYVREYFRVSGLPENYWRMAMLARATVMSGMPIAADRRCLYAGYVESNRSIVQ